MRLQIQALVEEKLLQPPHAFKVRHPLLFLSCKKIRERAWLLCRAKEQSCLEEGFGRKNNTAFQVPIFARAAILPESLATCSDFSVLVDLLHTASRAL